MWKNLIKIILITILYSFLIIVIYNSVKVFNENNNFKSYNSLSNTLMENKKITYEDNTSYFKGNIESNYIKISNLTFRVLSILNTGHVNVILNEPIISLMWNKEITKYHNTNINKYLNEEFIKYFNKDLFVRTTFCDDECYRSYVRLLDIETYNNTIVNNETFIKTKNPIWFADHTKEQVYVLKENEIMRSDSDNIHEFLPIMTLRNNITIMSGDGTMNSPYIVEEKSDFELDEYIKIDNDLWIVHKIDDEALYLQADFLINNGFITYRYDTLNRTFDSKNEHSIAKYLNTKYYESLSYKKIILDQTFNVGSYKGNYQDIKKTNTIAKIGLLSLLDANFNKELNNYALINIAVENVYYYINNSIKTIDFKISLPIRPTIKILKQDIIMGEGTRDNPYLLNFEYEKD